MMPAEPRTGASARFRIAALRPGDDTGRIGFSPCPGGGDDAPPGRDLGADLDRVREWGATAVVSLLEPREIEGDPGGLVRDRHMEWWSAPIPEGHPPGPEFEVVWNAVGEAVRDRLRLGFDVLFLSRRGPGRAGTVAARLLVELGAESGDAIRRVRSACAGSLETDPQRNHVERAAVRPPAAPLRSDEAIRDRGLGAFLGLAVGDAVGATLEFAERDARTRLDDMVGGGPFDLEAGQWTDDTAMALALAESLAVSGSLDVRDLMDRFLRWRRDGAYSCTGNCFDIGNTTRQALARYERTGDPVAGSTDPRSAGNGSLMRLAPIALRFGPDRAALDVAAAAQSRTTHATEEAVDACRAFATLLADAIGGMPRAGVLAPRTFRGAPGIAGILAGSWRGQPRNRIRSSGYVVDTLEAALWSVARTGDFRSAVLLAANLADDADTVAAVTGQIAGALYGRSGIPGEWLDKLAWRERLAAAGERLLDR